MTQYKKGDLVLAWDNDFNRKLKGEFLETIILENEDFYSVLVKGSFRYYISTNKNISPYTEETTPDTEKFSTTEFLNEQTKARMNEFAEEYLGGLPEPSWEEKFRWETAAKIFTKYLSQGDSSIYEKASKCAVMNVDDLIKQLKK